MDVPRTKVDDSSKRASRAELQGGQMSEAEMLALPILKVSNLLNYQSIYYFLLWSCKLVNVYGVLWNTAITSLKEFK